MNPLTLSRMASTCAAAALLMASALGTVSAAEDTETSPSEVPKVIIDTDIALWWDDVETIAMANVLQDQGLVEVLGIVVDVKSVPAAGAVDAIDTYYGNPDIPIGTTLGTEQDIFANVYTAQLAADFPNSFQDGGLAPDAVELYRELLAGQPDGGVVVLSIGGHTNLAALLASEGDEVSPLDGHDLVAAKVSELVIMDGEFPEPSRAWTNTLIDPPATKYVVNGGWPTPMTWVDATAGFPLMSGDTVCDAHADGPVRAAYEVLFGCGNPVGDSSWDPINVYYVAYGLGDGVLSVHGEGGAASVDFWGAISWQPSEDRADDRYLRVEDYEALTSQINDVLAYVPAKTE
jgi:inosine-uridine nucleoside N-ribohydrolase